MKPKLFLNKISVKKSLTHGYGVFADKKIRKGEKLEECYIIISRGGDKVLDDFYFEVQKRKYGVFTGYGSIYNHSDDPNADYFINVKTRKATFKAAKTIQKDEEILISYGEEWFSSRGLTAKHTRKAHKKRKK